MSFWNGHHWGADAPPAADVKREGRAKHVAKALLEASLITALTFGLIVGSTFAGKGGGGASTGGGGGRHGGGGSGGGTLTIVMVDDRNGNGAPNWNDTITYKVSSSSATPNVSTRCTQDGVLVYAADAGFYPSYPWPGAQNMPLYSPSWTGGAADCTTTINGSPSTSFHVGA